jgi:87kDa Transposase
VATTAHTNTIDQQNDEEYIPNVVFEKAGVQTTPEEISLELPTRAIEPFEVDDILPSISCSMHDVEDDGLEYALGFMVRKLGGNPQLGHFSYNTKMDHDYSSARYVHQLSFGGLTEPSTYMLDEGRKMNGAMKALHPFGHFSFKHNVVKRSVAYVRQFTTLPPEAIQLFVQLFIKFRIKRINREMRERTKKKFGAKKSTAEKKLIKMNT